MFRNSSHSNMCPDTAHHHNRVGPNVGRMHVTHITTKRLSSNFWHTKHSHKCPPHFQQLTGRYSYYHAFMGRMVGGMCCVQYADMHNIAEVRRLSIPNYNYNTIAHAPNTKWDANVTDQTYPTIWTRQSFRLSAFSWKVCRGIYKYELNVTRIDENVCKCHGVKVQSVCTPTIAVKNQFRKWLIGYVTITPVSTPQNQE